MNIKGHVLWALPHVSIFRGCVQSIYSHGVLNPNLANGSNIASGQPKNDTTITGRERPKKKRCRALCCTCWQKLTGMGIPFANLNNNSNNTDAFKYGWCGTAMYDFDTFQFTDTDYSGNINTGSNNVLYYFPNLLTSYGNSLKEFDWIKIVSPTRYERSTNTKTISITSDGKGQVTP